MERHEFHAKWCGLIDEMTVRMHQALLEGGYRCRIVSDTWLASGHVHKNLELSSAHSSDEVQRAALLALPAEMRDDWAAMKAVYA